MMRGKKLEVSKIAASFENSNGLSLPGKLGNLGELSHPFIPLFLLSQHSPVIFSLRWRAP